MNESNNQHFGMLIDLSLCIGCNACVVACKQENETPRARFNTWVESWDVDAGERGIRRANVPKQCNHCEDAPCVKVCPTGASYRTDEGVVLVDKDKCIGCKYCMAACPFSVRYQLDSGEVEKCTFCYHRTTEGLMPACASACVTRARYFGDLNDLESDISQKMTALKTEGIHADLNLKPSLVYAGLEESEAMPVVSAVHRGGNVMKPYEG